LEKESTLPDKGTPRGSVRVKGIAGTGMFSALALILTIISQTIGLNFPLVPYLQFDFGELAVLTAFLTIGPWSAITCAFVEFVSLMALGQNAPIGPVSKLVAILTSLLGLWVGIKMASAFASNRNYAAGSGLVLGLVSRTVFMTVLNYYLIVYVYTLGFIVAYLQTPIRVLTGIALTDSNALTVVLGLTALFNCIQLAMGFIVSYFLTRLPQIRRTLKSSNLAWFESIVNQRQQQKREQTTRPGQ